MSSERPADHLGPTEVRDPGRRAFILRVIGAISGLVAAALAVPVLGFGTAPGWRATTPIRLFSRSVPPTLRGEGWASAGQLEDFEIGVPKRVAPLRPIVDGWVQGQVPVAAFVLRRADRDVVAFDIHCTHLGCPLSYVEGARRFLCPCHGGVYDRDGTVVSGPPPRSLYQFQTEIQGNEVLLGPLLD